MNIAQLSEINGLPIAAVERALFALQAQGLISGYIENGRNSNIGITKRVEAACGIPALKPSVLLN